MACKVLMSVAATAAVWCTALRPVHAQNPTPTANAPAPPANGPATAPVVVVNTPDALRAILSNANAPQAERDEAARRLVTMNTQDAENALQQVLFSGNARGQQSAARALAEDPTPSPEYIDPLFAMIGNGSDAASAEAAARALAHLRGTPYARLRLLDASRNRQLPQTARSAVVRSLAPLADKATATTLIGILTNNAETATTRQIAADELAEMTGLTEHGRDAQRWAQWWAANQNKPDAQFDAEMVAARAARLDRLEPRFDRLVTEMRQLLRENFQEAPAANKEQVLLGYLRSTVGEVRQLGAEIVVDQFQAARPIPESATQELRSLIGDSDEQVRLQAAAAVREMNDKGALRAVLSQLEVERIPALRAALAGALAPMGDPRAIQPLVRLLRDDNPAVVQAAAFALQRLRDRLDNVDPKTVGEIGRALNDALKRSGAAGGGGGAEAAPLREQIVAAMVAWSTAEARETFINLLRPNEPPALRRLALRYFGQMDPDAPWPADNVVTSEALEDRDESIRLAAVEALARTAQAQHAQQLFARLSPDVEPSQNVRDAAWKAMAVLFPRLDIEPLNFWADKFKGSPERRLTILETLRDKLVPDKSRAKELAVVHQNIGEEYMQLGQFGPAAANFKAALEGGGRQGQVRELLVEQLIIAHLRAKNYEDATSFGAALIRENPRYQTTIGREIITEVQRLDRMPDTESALRLLVLSLKMDPPLAGSFHEKLRAYESELRKRIAAATAPAAP
ncbi:MAG: HEAT repeat domain-containing protein [Planctomycetota bacterium]|nr:HEAT repeat domain-containing protein [Planctomycetota bacterium]